MSNLPEDPDTATPFEPAPQIEEPPLPAELQPRKAKDIEGTQVAGFQTAGAFVLLQTMAKAMSQSDLVPVRYKGNIPNCVIAVELASRMDLSPLMVAQNLYVVNGSPAWAGQFVIGRINKHPRFTGGLQFVFSGQQGSDGWSCRAQAKQASDGQLLVGPNVTWAMVKAEGWLSKNASKWKTMPELMFHYRAGAFFGRVYCPEVLMGMPTTEELYDVDAGKGAAKAELVSRFAPVTVTTVPAEAETFVEKTDECPHDGDPATFTRMLDGVPTPCCVKCGEPWATIEGGR